ncbi:ABC transporter permease subunit [Kushneria phosphatilytica]|uniref:ABC transporter permease subunit n=1 Tax=Kushneria phosphatilytica TaxID=657387 RepID=A0A1S1NZ92_9GAMM|nr:ABC transporter permease subunit [Kushneria phosphatilytica]OHV12193.1 peptide ABC transporter permease [Kushneria phosphatilytica]QEL11385.1 ABC transporter permease subunit [Kushneria phosphatilytica]
MLNFLFRKLLMIVPTFLGVTIITFALVHMIPGDPVAIMAGERGLSPERHAQMMAQLGLDRPLWEQYMDFLWRLLHGDLGQSLVTHNAILNEFMSRFPATLELSICALIFAIGLGIPLGVIAGIKRGSIIDHGVMGTALTGYSMPIFWWGLLLIILFSGILGWTPVSGRLSSSFWIDTPTHFMLIDTLLSDAPGAFPDALRHLILPAVCLGTIPLAVIARMTRSSILEVLGEDYIRTARAKGLAPWRIIAIHALRNAMIPVTTVIGLQIGLLFAGAILTETIFSWPGIGKWLIDSVSRRDYPALQGGILLIATMVMIVNLVVDLLYGLINPRIRHQAE